MLNIKSKNYLKLITLVIMILSSFIRPTYAVSGEFNKGSNNLVIGDKIAKNAKYLFVLHSEEGYLTNRSLVIKDFYQHLIYFSDMPHRIAGNYDSVTFLKDWNDIFSSENPNVVLSFYDKKSKKYKDISITISNPVIDEEDVHFKIEQFLDKEEITLSNDNNKILLKFKDSSLFIDSIFCFIPSCFL